MASPNSDATFPEDMEVQKIPLQKLTFWDITDYPQSNLRLLKRGQGLALRGAVVGMFKDGRRKFVDGLPKEDGDELTPSDIIGEQVIEPDNWVLRLHQARGLKNLSTWAVRLIADNTRDSTDIANSSTMIVDQDDEQRWAPLSDAFQVTAREMGAPPEMSFNGAAFLDLAYPKEKQSGGTGAINQLAYKVSDNQGMVTDTKKRGPLSHILAWLKKVGSNPDTATGTKKGSTVAEKKEEGAGGAGNRPTEEWELGLLAGLGFKWPGDKIRSLPDIEAAPTDPKDEGEPRLVHFFEGAALDDTIDMGTDKKSPFSKIKRSKWPAIAAYVKVPTPAPIIPEKQPPCANTPKPPTEASSDTAMPPSKSGAANLSNGFPTDVPQFNPGQYESFTMEIPIPPNTPATSYLVIDIPVALGAAYGKGESTPISVGYAVATNCDAGGAPAQTWAAKTLTSADGLHTNNYRSLQKVIPPTALVTALDKIVMSTVNVTVSMNSTSTGPPVLVKNPTAEIKDSGGLVIPESLDVVV